MKPLPLGLVVAMCIWFQSLSSDCRAGFQFLGPTPYLSAADSPFPVDGSNPNFFLEDFEDGELNTPGIFQPLIPATHAIVRGPSPHTNSVDADDGSIDGRGMGGHSLASNFYMFLPTDPPRSRSFIRFSFDETELGYLPTCFGFVWTHGVSNSIVKVEVFDEEFRSMGSSMVGQIGFADVGDTEDDRFLGVVGSKGIAAVEIMTLYQGLPSVFEIDHVQYGLVVPETALFAVAWGFALTFCWTRARRR